MRLDLRLDEHMVEFPCPKCGSTVRAKALSLMTAGTVTTCPKCGAGFTGRDTSQEMNRAMAQAEKKTMKQLRKKPERKR